MLLLSPSTEIETAKAFTTYFDDVDNRLERLHDGGEVDIDEWRRGSAGLIRIRKTGVDENESPVSPVDSMFESVDESPKRHRGFLVVEPKDVEEAAAAAAGSARNAAR